MYYDSYLAHYGIKGMKWGVRREQKRQKKLAKKYTKKIKKNWINIHNRAAEINNKKGDELFNKYANVNFKKDRKAYKQYVKEYVDTWNNDLVSEVKRQLGDAPENVTTNDILSFLPTAISKEGAQELYNRFYEEN